MLAPKLHTGKSEQVLPLRSPHSPPAPGRKLAGGEVGFVDEITQGVAELGQEPGLISKLEDGIRMDQPRHRPPGPPKRWL